MKHGLYGLVVALWGLAAQAQDNYFNPGTMGANALPSLAPESAAVDPEWALQAGLAGQLSSLNEGRDYSFIVPFEGELAFASRASLRLAGTPIEGWVTSSATGAAWRAARQSQITRGDLRIQAKFLLYRGSFPAPLISVRVTTKSTTGKDAALHRFLNAPAYQFDLLATEVWKLSSSWTLELWATAGFLAWQQASFGQNDAPAWSVALTARHPAVQLTVEHRGYSGWQQFDKPVTLGARAEIPLGPHLSLVFAVLRTFRDPDSWDARVSLRAHGGVPQWLE